MFTKIVEKAGKSDLWVIELSLSLLLVIAGIFIVFFVGPGWAFVGGFEIATRIVPVIMLILGLGNTYNLLTKNDKTFRKSVLFLSVLLFIFLSILSILNLGFFSTGWLMRGFIALVAIHCYIALVSKGTKG